MHFLRTYLGGKNIQCTTQTRYTKELNGGVG